MAVYAVARQATACHMGLVTRGCGHMSDVCDVPQCVGSGLVAVGPVHPFGFPEAKLGFAVSAVQQLNPNIESHIASVQGNVL